MHWPWRWRADYSAAWRGFFFLDDDTDMSKPKGSFLTMQKGLAVPIFPFFPFRTREFSHRDGG